jgi:hydroxymethylpyrimidine pyrophosphatase-like HAD family hydrolase
MHSPIKLLSIDFDGTLVSRNGGPALDIQCMELIGGLQRAGTIWAINTGRSVDLLETGLAEFAFPIRPDFVLTMERDVFRRRRNGRKWEPFGGWNERCARDHAELFLSADSVLAEFVNFAAQKTNARLIYNSDGLEGLVAESEEEMDRITEFIRQARAGHPKLDYQRNGVYLRFCHADYHKGAALGELARLLKVSRENIFAAGDHHNDVSMLDGRFAAMPSCPANAIPEVQDAVRNAGGYIAQNDHGAGVCEALLHFVNPKKLSGLKRPDGAGLPRL